MHRFCRLIHFFFLRQEAAEQSRQQAAQHFRNAAAVFKTLTSKEQAERFSTINKKNQANGYLAEEEQRQWLELINSCTGEWQSLLFRGYAALGSAWFSKTNLYNLTVLELTDCRRVSDEVFTLISLSSPSLRALTVINLPSVGMIKHMAKTVFGSWRETQDPVRFQELQSLALEGNINLRDVVIHSPKIKTLNTKECHQLQFMKFTALGDNGAIALSESLRSTRNIRRLDLSSNRIGNSGARALLESLRENPDIQTCDLRDNWDIGHSLLLELWERLPPERPLIATDHEEIYRLFYNGKLVYKPDPSSEEGKIEFPIGSLLNPLDGTFDLSRCGDTGKYLSIHTGYKRGRIEANKDKVEIWFVPRFMVERELNGAGRHYQPIMNAEKWPAELAPIGIIWTWWNDDLKYYDYLTTQSPENLSDNNLYDLARIRDHLYGLWPPKRHVVGRAPSGRGRLRIHVRFVNKDEGEWSLSCVSSGGGVPT